VRIRGDVGGRLGSSLGVDLARFGGTGGTIEGAGSIIVDGDVGPRMGISMIRGSIYVSGNVATPLGNVAEVESDLTGYQKYVSITEILERGGGVCEPNLQGDGGLVLKDGLIRETLAARSRSARALRVKGDAGSYICAKMTGGLVYASRGKPIPPAKAQPLKGDDAALVSKVLGLTSFQAMMYRKFGL
jgi:formylmethanofuran dehydrogenase subunit C